ncbi:MAG: hypothetical protein SFW36_09890 [Leptolyngbyaceae cyanobacterium bins.59]|nr:hypothetical protein [Leptolyngbyaceae cyanobacterium bins.59]
MSEDELYDATRGVWKISDRREGVKLAFAIFEGIVREVYEVEKWHPAGTTIYKTRADDDVNHAGRWEFTGHKANAEIRSRYYGGSVESYFPKGLQTPYKYVNA